MKVRRDKFHGNDKRAKGIRVKYFINVSRRTVSLKFDKVKIHSYNTQKSALTYNEWLII